MVIEKYYTGVREVVGAPVYTKPQLFNKLKSFHYYTCVVYNVLRGSSYFLLLKISLYNYKDMVYYKYDSPYSFLIFIRLHNAIRLKSSTGGSKDKG